MKKGTRWQPREKYLDGLTQLHGKIKKKTYLNLSERQESRKIEKHGHYFVLHGKWWMNDLHANIQTYVGLYVTLTFNTYTILLQSLTCEHQFCCFLSPRSLFSLIVLDGAIVCTKFTEGKIRNPWFTSIIFVGVDCQIRTGWWHDGSEKQPEI